MWERLAESVLRGHRRKKLKLNCARQENEMIKKYKALRT